jgi:hypothetical protein
MPITTSVAFCPSIYDVATSRPLAVLLRPGKTPSGQEVTGHLRRLVRRIRRHWPTTRITLRGDSHYGRREVMDFCEKNDIDFVFGLSTTARSIVPSRSSPTISAPAERSRRRRCCAAMPRRRIGAVDLCSLCGASTKRRSITALRRTKSHERHSLSQEESERGKRRPDRAFLKDRASASPINFWQSAGTGRRASRSLSVPRSWRPPYDDLDDRRYVRNNHYPARRFFTAWSAPERSSS